LVEGEGVDLREFDRGNPEEAPAAKLAVKDAA